MEIRIEDALREAIQENNEAIQWLEEHIDQLEGDPEYEYKHEMWYSMLNRSKYNNQLFESTLKEINELKGRSQRY